MSMQKRRNEQDKIEVKKNFSSLPVPLRQLVLSKTDTDTRLKLFQMNKELRKWVLKQELFGEDLEQVVIGEPEENWSTFNNQAIEPDNEYVFKLVRRCNWLHLDYDFALTETFPRLQSINYFRQPYKNFTQTSRMLMGTAIQITAFFSFDFDVESIPTDPGNREIFLQFIENHLKRCKTVDFGRYPLKDLFDILGTHRFPQAIFKYSCTSRDGAVHFERDLKILLNDGIPSLYPDSSIWMIIQEGEAEGLVRFFNFISERSSLVNKENEAIRNKFLVSYKKVGGSLISDPFTEEISINISSDLSDADYWGLKRKFDDKRNLIFLVYSKKKEPDQGTHIHIKFDPIFEFDSNIH